MNRADLPAALRAPAFAHYTVRYVGALPIRHYVGRAHERRIPMVDLARLANLALFDEATVPGAPVRIHQPLA